MNSIGTDPSVFQILSTAGVAFAVLGVLIAGFAYRGKEAEAYSPLNHFISELGERGVSRYALAFNLGLILSGFSLLMACIDLGLILPGWMAKVGLVFGAATAISLSLVGVFPMDKLGTHTKVAVAFFRSGLAMVLSFSAAIVLQPDCALLPRVYALAGLPAILAFGSFLVLMSIRQRKAEQPLGAEHKQRPRVWRAAILEWSIFFTIVLWFVIIAVGLS